MGDGRTDVNDEKRGLFHRSRCRRKKGEINRGGGHPVRVDGATRIKPTWRQGVCYDRVVR